MGLFICIVILLLIDYIKKEPAKEKAEFEKVFKKHINEHKKYLQKLKKKK